MAYSKESKWKFNTDAVAVHKKIKISTQKKLRSSSHKQNNKKDTKMQKIYGTNRESPELVL